MRSMIHIGQCIVIVKMNYITTTQAAAMINTTQRTIQKHCALQGFKKFGRDYQLTAEQVEQIRRIMVDNPRGRPKKERA